MRRLVVAASGLCLLLSSCDSGKPAPEKTKVSAEAKASAEAEASENAKAAAEARAAGMKSQQAKADTKPEAEAKTATKADITTNAAPDSAAKPKRYEIESGYVHYELKGAREGTIELFFTDFGAHEAKLTLAEHTGAMKAAPPLDELVILDGDVQHTIDRTTNTGTTMEGLFEAFERMAKPKPGRSMTSIGLAMLEAMGGKKTGTRTVAGIECDVYEVEMTKTETCIKGGVTLAVTVSMAGVEQTQTATEVEFGASVPAGQFAIPEGVTLKKMELPAALGGKK